MTAAASLDRRALAKALVWTLAAALAAGYLANEGIRTVRVMWGWETANARVFQTSESTLDDGDGREAEVTVAEYEFVVSGQRFTGGAVGDREVGDEVVVRFDPRDPSQNRAQDDRRSLSNYVVLGSLGAMLCYFVLLENLPILHQAWRVQFAPPPAPRE